jgi:hypothetical protein
MYAKNLAFIKLLQTKFICFVQGLIPHHAVNTFHLGCTKISANVV